MLATTESRSTGLYFVTEGMNTLSTELWGDVHITVVYNALVSRIGFTPRYLNNNFYLTSYISQVNGVYKFRVDSFTNGIEKRHAETILPSLIFPATLTCEIIGSYYVFTVNGVEVAKFEFISITQGNIMIHAGAGDTCLSAVIKEPQATTWYTNAGTNGVTIKQTEEEDETQQLTLVGTPVTKAQAWKTIKSVNGAHALSFTGIGNGTVEFDGITTALSGTQNYSIKRTVAGPKDVLVRFSSNERLSIQEPQLEKGTFNTPYIPNDSETIAATREESILSFPAVSNFDKVDGTMYLSVNPKTAMSTFTLFETDTKEFVLRYASGKLTWSVLGQSVELTMPFTTAQEIICKWDTKKLTLISNGLKTEKSVALPVAKTPKTLMFTRTSEVGYVVIDDIIIWSSDISADSIGTVIPSPAGILLHATFQKAISGKGVSWFEVPVAPEDGSPILVEKNDGDNMKKVSFFDLETGKYRTYNEELFLYDGKSDYVEVAFDNLNEDFFDLMVRTEEGEKIGAPYTIDGKRIWFSLAPSEKELHNRKRLYVRYQINDSYVVDYNISAVDGYRIDFAKHDGQEKTVFQEGNRYAEPYKLATMVEMNPIMNQNHEGFLYVTNNTHDISSFKVTVTPEHVPADGGSMSLVLIEPVDTDGNFIPIANLLVDAQYGQIHRVPTLEAAEAQKRSGMYIYQYYPPFLDRKTNARNVEEKIWIVDEDTGIGMQYTFLIRPMIKRHPVQFTADNATSALNRAFLFDCLLMYEGMEEQEDPVLFNILDLNKDEKLSWEDIQYLESGAIDNMIASIVTRIKVWEGNDE